MKRFAIVALLAMACMGLTARAQGPRGGGPMAAEFKVVQQFDKNGDGWLNAEERKAAREFVQAQGFGFRGGGRGRGGFPGGAPSKGAMIAPVEVKTYPNAHFYDESVLRTLFFTFENNDWENELEVFKGTDVDTPATLLVDGKTYRDVGVHFRGMSSFGGVPPGLKRSLNVSMDMAHSDQKLPGGYNTLNLLNSHEDPTFMRAVLFLHIARQYIPAPKANFVRVVVNGENWGIYASVQQFNKEFIKENYKDSDGARWKAPGPSPQSGLQYLGDNAAPYKGLYEIKTKDDPAQWEALVNLCRTLTQTPVDQLQTALSPILNVDGALRFLALDNALVNNDGYWSRASDYNIYRDPSGKFHILPHDTNETFGLGGGPVFIGGGGPVGGPGVVVFGPRGGVPPPPPPPPPGFPQGFPGGPGLAGGPRGGGASLDPLIGLSNGAPLRSKLLAVPAYREKYLEYVREIATKWLDWKTLGPLVEQYKTLIDADVKLDTKKLESYEAFVAGTTGSTASLKTFAADRSQFLTR